MARASERPRRGSKSAKPQASFKRRKPRPGLPDKSSIMSVKTLTSPKGNRYRIIETDETDAYDPAADPTKRDDR